MAICPNCSQEIKEDASICPKCGEAMKTGDTPKQEEVYVQAKMKSHRKNQLIFLFIAFTSACCIAAGISLNNPVIFVVSGAISLICIIVSVVFGQLVDRERKKLS